MDVTRNITKYILLQKSVIVSYQGSVSRKPRKLFGPLKPFLVHLYLKTEICIPEISFVKRTSVYINNMLTKQLCNHKLRDFATVFRVRELFGTFEKRAAGPGCSKPD